MPSSTSPAETVTRKHDRIPPEFAHAMYTRAMDLASTGLGGIRIARKLSLEYSLRVSPGSVNHWIYGDRKPRLRNVFIERPSPSLSYVMGSNIGDGCKLTKSGCVKLEVTDLDFAQEFNSNIATLFSRSHANKILVRRFDEERLPLFVVRYNSKQLTKLLQRSLQDLLEIASDYPGDFLRGLFDAEGYVAVHAKSDFQVLVGLEHTNAELLDWVKRTLRRSFQIESRINLKRKSGTLKTIRGKSFRMKKTSFSLHITGIRNLQRLDEEVGFSISRKTEKMRDAMLVLLQFVPRKRAARWMEMYSKHKGRWPKLPIDGELSAVLTS